MIGQNAVVSSPRGGTDGKRLEPRVKKRFDQAVVADPYAQPSLDRHVQRTYSRSDRCVTNTASERSVYVDVSVNRASAGGSASTTNRSGNG
ncbi:hypothetical protein D8S78_11970 [Natrialba swarupiae]|nr:hypothetical protein [Natrialba swarupiae]